MGNEREDEFLGGLLRRIIEEEGFADDAEIILRSGSGIGDGFLSNNSAIELRSGNKSLKLFAKVATKNETIRRQIQTKSLFGREIHFYGTVYPTFLKFQAERNVKQPFDNAPRCYLTSAEILREVLIFEDLKEQGYVLYNRKVEMNTQFITLVFKLYARFHAVSFAMKDQEHDSYIKLIGNMKDLAWAFFKTAGLDEAFVLCWEELKALFDPIEDTYVSNRIKNLTETLVDTLSNLDEIVDDYSVITHGDSWCNNFLFKYNNQNGVEDAKVLDFQVMRVNSPVLDLSYFFYAIATKPNLDHLDFYLKTYHDTLSENIREMGSDPEKLYPYQVFTEQWKKHSKFGLTMSSFIQKVILMDEEEMPNPIEAVSSGKKFGDAFKMPLIRNEDLYRERIKDVVRHFIDNDFI